MFSMGRFVPGRAMALQAHIISNIAQAQRFGSRIVQAQSFDMRVLLRLALWGGAAAAALSVAVLSARSNIGSQRLTIAMSGRASQSGVQQAAVNAQLAARTAETEIEARRLSEAMRALTADRDRLLTRLTLVERNIEDVTGSIRRQAEAPATAPVKEAAPTKAAAGAPQLDPTMFGPPTIPQGTAPPPSAAQAPTTAPTASQAAIPPVARQPLPAIVAAAPANDTADPQADKSKTEYAVDIGGAVNFDGLRVLWNSARSTNIDLFEELRPMYIARENRSRGIDLRLIVGPLPSTEEVTRLCATLLAARRHCQMTIFEGQQLSLVAPELERRPATPQTRPPATRTRVR
jgi:cell division septation protein DedD